MTDTTEVKFLSEMPYGGKRYKKGQTAQVENKFVRALVALKKVEVSTGEIDESPKKEDKKSYKTKDMKAE